MTRENAFTEDWYRKQMAKKLVVDRDTGQLFQLRDTDPIDTGRQDGSAAVSWRPPSLQGRDAAAPLLECHVPGLAIGKPRMTQQDKWKQRGLVVAYRAWCDQVRASAGWMAKRRLRQPVRLCAEIYLPMPSSWPPDKRLAHAGCPHTGKPDLDNLVKGVMDALFINDEYVAVLDARKFWMPEPWTHICVEEL